MKMKNTDKCTNKIKHHTYTNIMFELLLELNKNVGVFVFLACLKCVSVSLLQ